MTVTGLDGSSVTNQNEPPELLGPGAGAVAFYTFDDTSGGIARDQQDNHDGTIIGAAPAPGRTGDALQFNGSQYVSVPDSPDWTFGGDDFSIVLWANFSSAPGGPAGAPQGGVLVAHDEGGGETNKWWIAAYSGNLGVHVNSPTLGPQFFAETPFNPVPGEWYFIALTKSGLSYQLYVNDQLGGSAIQTFAIPDANAPLTIGQGEGFYFNGMIDGLGIYHRALLQDELLGIYQRGAGVPDDATAVSIAENTTAVTTVAATDPDAGQTLIYSIAGGTDANLFAINAATGALAFVAAPDFEQPTDAGHDNIYNITVQVSDGAGGTDTQAIAVTVTNVDDIVPTIGSITRNDAATTNAQMVNYTVTFSEPVTGVDVHEFSLVTSGVSGASIANVVPVVGSSGTQYTVSVSTGSGDGAVALSFVGSNVHDLAGNPIPGGTFQTVQTLSGGMVGHLTAGDVNGDGHQDLVSENDTGGVAVALGNGDGTFGAPTVFPAGDALNGITVGDVNNDTFADIIASNSNAGTVSILLGTGDGTFAAPITAAADVPFPSDADLGDFDEDGYADLVLKGSLLFGNGDGTFQSPVHLPTVNAFISAVGDLDHDGHLDIINSSFGTGVQVFLGNGDGTFAEVAGLSGLGYWSLLADFNNDGDLDIAFTEYNGSLMVALGNGDGSFQPQMWSPIPNGGAGSIVSQDANSDGNTDLLYYDANDGGASYGISLLLGNGDGTFQAPHFIANGGTLSTRADFDADGRPDIAVYNAGVSTVMLNRPPTVVGPAYTIDKFDAPTTGAASVVTVEDVTHTFALADFPFSDSNDAWSHSLTNVIVTSLPTSGTLFYDGQAISAAQAAAGFAVSSADIAAGKLTYAPPANGNGAGLASFSFRVQDTGLPAAGTLATWTFDGTAADISGYGRNLTLNGGASFATGLSGQALSLDGAKASGAILSTAPAAFDLAANDFTIQVWTKFNDLSHESVLIEKWTNDSGPGWTFTRLDDGRLQFYAAGVAILTTGPLPIDTGVWHQFVAERSGDTFSIFLDGALVMSGTGSGAIIASPAPLLLGGRNAGDPRNFTVDGEIDNVVILNHAWSSEEVAGNWNGGAGIVIGQNLSNSATMTIGVTSVNDAPTGQPFISDVTPTESQVVSVSRGSIDDPDGTTTSVFSYQWQAFNGTVWSDIAGATSSNLVPSQAQVGQTLRAVVRFTDDSGTPEAVTSDATGIVGDLVTGNNSANVLTGTAAEDILNGLGGNDTLNGLAGNDVLNGGAGNNRLNGGTGDDAMTGGTNNDTYVVDSLGDTVIEAVGGGTDTIETTLNSFSLVSLANLENLTFTGAGDFIGTGNALSNTIRGGNGSDRFVATIGDGNDSYFGGNGMDTIDLSGTTAAATVTGSIATSAQIGSDTLSGIENIIGSQGNDQITGTGGANAIEGRNGNDIINAGGGDDRVVGEAGNDTMDGGGGSDTFVFAPGFGNDNINAFDANPIGGQDFLDISAIGITAGDFATRVAIADVGTDTLVTIDSDPSQTIRLIGIGNATTVTQSDFLL
ncbi:Ca2+-binding RTX toxin-like protein [Bradyrhizobium sp. USDA 4524]